MAGPDFKKNNPQIKKKNFNDILFYFFIQISSYFFNFFSLILSFNILFNLNFIPNLILIVLIAICFSS
jgi:hypothetical protein